MRIGRCVANMASDRPHVCIAAILHLHADKGCPSIPFIQAVHDDKLQVFEVRHPQLPDLSTVNEIMESLHCLLRWHEQIPVVNLQNVDVRRQDVRAVLRPGWRAPHGTIRLASREGLLFMSSNARRPPVTTFGSFKMSVEMKYFY